MKKSTTAAALAGILALAVPLASPAQATPRGTTSIAQVLAADGLELDSTWRDFDILDQAVDTVIGARPASPVTALADGDTRLTAFAPTDRAFRRLVTDLTGSRPSDEQATFDAVASLGVDTVETVLLYHVVPGAPITYKKAQQADGAALAPARGGHLRVAVRPRSGQVYLRDEDKDDRNARVIRGLSDINKGNRQIAHGISEVLRPLDL